MPPERKLGDMFTSVLHRSVVAGLAVLTLIVVTGAVPVQIAQTHV